MAAFGVNLFGTNLVDVNRSGGLFGGGGADMVLGLMSIFGGGGLFGGGGMFGGGSVFGGGYNSCGQDYGNDFGGGNSYGGDYGNRNERGNSGSSFFSNLLKGFGFAMLAKMILPGLASNNSAPANEGGASEPAATNVPADPKVEPKVLNMAKEFDNWSQLNSSKYEKGEKVEDFNFVGPEFAKDIKENGGKNAGKLYKEGLMNLSDGYFKLYDGNNDSKINYKEFSSKELADYKKAFPDGKIDAKSKLQMDAITKNAFKNMDINHDGSISKKEEAAVFATFDQDAVTKEHNGKIDMKSFADFGSAIQTEDASAKLKKSYDMFFGD